MTRHDIFLLSPELSVVVLALAIVLLDLVWKRKGALAALCLVGLLAPIAFSIALWVDVGASAGGQLPGVFGTLVVDKFSLFFKFFVVGAVALVVLASQDYVSRFSRFQGEYYALVLFSATGMMLLASTTELVSIYVSLELATLPLAALAAFMRDSRSSEAGMKFLVLSAISSALLLYGMAMVMGLTGSTKLGDIAAAVAASLGGDKPFGSYGLLLGVVLIVAGFGFKVSSFPFQMWVPDVYQGAPTPITAYLSVASKGAGFAVLLRVFYLAFAPVSGDWWIVFAVLSAISMSIGNLVAMAQSDIKRMLAYSTIAHAGYMIMGLAAIAARNPAGETLGPGGILFYLGTYLFTNLAAFFAIIAISNKVGSERIEDYAGMGQRAPLLALALALSMISLTGIPPTAGFMGKLYIFNAALQSGLAWLVLIGVVNSVASAYYYIRVVRVMYLAPASSGGAVPSSVALRVALALTTLGIVFFGVFPAPLISFAQTAVAALF